MAIGLSGLLIGVLGLGSAALVSPRAPIRAMHTVELDDPAGDVGPIQWGTADHMETVPGFDMVHLSIRSDGRQLTFAATLTEPPVGKAGRAVDFYIDADNDAKTGARLPALDIGGFEYALHLDSCVNYDDHLGTTCGVSRKAKPTANSAAILAERYKGPGAYDVETVLDDSLFEKPKPSVKTPVAGKVLEASVDYKDLQLKPGQTIRIVAGEWTKRRPGSTNIPDFCPEILLTLK